MAEALVSVIVPAYNAAATLKETLDSASRQTYRSMEILVVDDGSRDDTAHIAEEAAKSDARIRVLRQPNAGVAAARNLAIAEAKGEFVAPFDADDLWRSDKIEKQVARMAAAGSRCSLVYTWSAIIDRMNRISSRRSRPSYEGDVIRTLASRGNFIGNGSSPLMRRSVVIDAGGYDPGLRAAGGQGCEDYKIYFQVAEMGQFALVPAFLTGYRYTPDNMSSDVLQMLRSYDLVVAWAKPRHPELADAFSVGHVETLRWLLIRALRTGQWGPARDMVRRLMRHDVNAGSRLLMRLPFLVAREMARDSSLAKMRFRPNGARLKFEGANFLVSANG